MKGFELGLNFLLSDVEFFHTRARKGYRLTMLLKNHGKHTLQTKRISGKYFFGSNYKQGQRVHKTA